MSVFNNSENDLKHPAFHDEKIEKKIRTWSQTLDCAFKVITILGLVAWGLFCIWVINFK